VHSTNTRAYKHDRAKSKQIPDAFHGRLQSGVTLFRVTRITLFRATVAGDETPIDRVNENIHHVVDTNLGKVPIVDLSEGMKKHF
jgi:hypothetical protein